MLLIILKKYPLLIYHLEHIDYKIIYESLYLDSIYNLISFAINKFKNKINISQ